MKLLRKILPALAICVTCFSCNSNTIKITLNATIGRYSNNSSIKTIVANKGVRLSQINFESPVSEYCFAPSSLEPDYLDVKHWENEKGEVYQDTVINSNITLYACYYDSIEEERTKAISYLCYSYNQAYATASDKTKFTEVCETEFISLLSEIVKEDSPYLMVSIAYIFDPAMRAIPQSFGYAKSFLKIMNNSIELSRKMKNDQRSLSYIDVTTGICNMGILRPETSFKYGIKIFNIMDKYIENLNPNFYYFYHQPGDAIIRALGQQQQGADILLKMLEIFSNGCTHADTLGQVSAISKALDAIAFASILKPDSLEDVYLPEYRQLVKDLTGAEL